MRMKKWAALLLAIVFIVSLAGCGSSSQQKAQAPAANEKIVIKLGDVLADDHPHTQSYHFFAKRVSELTNGKVEVQVFPNSQLGNQRDMVEGMQMGSIQMGKSMMTVLAGFLPEVQVFDLPYLFRDREHYYKVMDSQIGQSFLSERMPKVGLVGIAFFDAGQRSVYNSKRPIKTMDDMKGLKLRVPESPIYIDMMASFGAIGTPMPVGEMYSALQSGVIDGAENAPIFYDKQKHFEVAKYFSNTGHNMPPDVLLMSKKFYDSLPQDVQKAIMQAGKETQQYERKLWQELETKTIADLKAKGVQFNDVDTKQFQEAAKKVWVKYEDKLGKQLIQQIVDTK